MRMPWSRRGARAASTHFVKVRGVSARPKGRTPFLKSVFTICSITSACLGPTKVGMTPLKRSGGKPTEYDSLLRSCAGPTETHLAVVSLLLNSLLRESVSRD